MILGTSSNECPVSVITDRSKALIQEYAKAKLLRESMGVSMYGSDLRDWPAYLVDAFMVLQAEHQEVEFKKSTLDSGLAGTE